MASASTSRLLACVTLLVASLVPAAAQDAWKVDKFLRGEVKTPAEFEKSTDVSGIACDTRMDLPRLCLVVDDETQGAQIVLLKESKLRAGGFITLTHAEFAGEPLELDAEAVAFDAGRFYVVGSHGRARHEKENDPKKEEENKAENDAKAAASREIFRIDLPASAVDMKTGAILTKADITPSSALAAILQGHPELRLFYDKPLDENGLTIEGLAVRDRILFVGLRGPVLGTDAIVVSVTESAVFDGQRPEPRLHRLALEKDTASKTRGVRDLVRYRDGFLVLAGPVDDPPKGKPVEDGDYSIYFWDGKTTLGPRADLKSFGKKTKPEALLPLEGNATRVRILLLFDGPEEGSPTAVEIKLQ